MIVSSVGASGQAVAEASAKRNQLNMEDFLNLLMMQLKSQNPLDPMDNAQFVSQMAQFSNLEMLGNMGGDLSEMVAIQKVVEARQLIGKQVDFLDKEGGTLLRGIVDAVEMKDNSPQLVIGGTRVDPSSIVRTSQPTVG